MAEKIQSGYERLKDDIRTGVPARGYIFHGEETYLRDYYIAHLRAMLVEPSLKAFNYRAFEGAALDMDKLESAVDSPPMLSERIFVLVRDYDFWGLDERARGRFVSLISDLPPYCCLVFVFDTVEYQPDRRKKALAEAVERSLIEVEFARRESGELHGWVRRTFREFGCDIDRERTDYLLFLCGGLMTNLRSEIEKIAARTGGGLVTREDIDAVAVPVAEAVVFDLTDALAKNDAAAAVGVLEKLFMLREEPIRLLSVIGGQMRNLAVARLAFEKRKTPSELAQALGYRSDYPARRLLDAARGLTLVSCMARVKLCAEYDLRLKSAGADREEIMRELILRLCL